MPKSYKKKKSKRKYRNKKRKHIKKRRYTKKRRQKKRNYTKKIKKEMCSPRKNSDMLSYTCYTKKALINLKNIWNIRHPDYRIKTNTPYKIWFELKNKFSDTCNKESCWLKHKCLKENIDQKDFSKLFAPKMPESWKKKPNEWLSSVDIMKVMKQYEDAYHNFEFLGPSPIDFDTHKYNGECVWEELCEFSLKDTISRGKKKIGIIFNLDPHYKQGSHWVALFIDTNKKETYYFDSYGEKLPKQIKKFIDMVGNQGATSGHKYVNYYNKTRHQYGNSECGMYCLYVIIQMVKGVAFKNLMKKKIPDLKMLKLRQLYFNK